MLSGGGGGIRTRDLWVMSPTSCRCSTPRHAVVFTRGDGCVARVLECGAGVPQRPRLPRGHPRSTLRRCPGSRPGSGWDRVEPQRSRPRTPPRARRDTARDGMLCGRGAGSPLRVGTGRCARRGQEDEDPPSAMSTGRLRSVTRRPPPASQPGRLPGAFLLSNGETRLGSGIPA